MAGAYPGRDRQLLSDLFPLRYRNGLDVHCGILFRLKTAEHPENCLNKKLSRHLVQVRSFDECFGIGVLRGSKYVQAVALFDHFAIF